VEESADALARRDLPQLQLPLPPRLASARAKPASSCKFKKDFFWVAKPQTTDHLHTPHHKKKETTNSNKTVIHYF
jgi:hypothetical protein